MMVYDAIERIAIDFCKYNVSRLRELKNARSVIDRSKDYQTAIDILRNELNIDADMYTVTTAISVEIGCIERCLRTMEETVKIAHKVFFVNFFDSEKYFVFNQEICFSYVCKLHNTMGPLLIHFSNNPTKKEVVDAELKVAMHSPMILSDLDIFCYETMPERDTISQIRPRK